ncbi:MAG: hypothetical protein QGI24_09990 [Kiritimatiellia bacterium]|jgi:hypothetical protein|nr:hypothetical protein [Kiritimatiellia bacterium]MDP6849106.1 hypothetical protein [Kiritimatiellia bacterium]
MRRTALILSILALAVGSSVAATLRVNCDRALMYNELKPAAPVNSNREYVFGAIPKELTGLQYALHEHKAPGSVSVEVKEAGVFYICVIPEEKAKGSKLSPKDLKLKGDWTEAGESTTEAFGTYKCSFYKTSVTKGQKLTIPSVNKWGTIVLAKQIDGLSKCSPSSVARMADQNKAAPKQGGGTGKSEEFNQLANQIRERPKWNNARLEKEALRKEALVLETDKNPVDIVLRRTAALINDLRKMKNGPKLDNEAKALLELKTAHDSSALSLDEIFAKATALRRKVAFQNPLLDFDNILFVKHNKQRGGDNHMVDQYLGFNQDPRGGVYLLKDAFGEKAEAVSLLKEAPVTNGRLQGKTIEDNGSFMSLDLDYDAKSILFAFTEAQRDIPKGFDPSAITDEVERLKNGHVTQKKAGHGHYLWLPERVFHVFKMEIDPALVAGRNLKQMTFGPYNDFDPCFLPSGRIAFISGRTGGNQRCGTRMCSTYTLHGMMQDGSDIIRLSYHDTNEWHPSVDNDGMIVYTRWDYVDRDSDIAHHIWHCFPDGRDPRSYHGNWPDKREMRPWMEMAIRAIPDSPNYISVSTPHHGQNYGSMVMIDLRKEDDKAMSQVKRVTPEAHLPESESAPGVAMGKGRHRNNGEAYGQPWPLSEDYYLSVYDYNKRNYGVYLVDSFGNKELLYRDPSISCLDPIPLKSRKRPPSIPVATKQAIADRDSAGEDLSEGTVTVMNIYEGEYDWPEGTKIKELRIINIFSKPNLTINYPNIGKAAQSLARGVLGTVPVEEDGSVHFKMPTEAPVYFQALDENGLCVMSMKSSTYLHPGESMSCIGCHESKSDTPKNVGRRTPLAMKRAPSKIKPEAEGSYPLTFPRLVQPVLNKHCVECHEKGIKGKKGPSLRGDVFAKNGWSAAFSSLQKLAWGKAGGNGAISSNGRSYSLPGKDGARVSKLYQHLAKGHHDVKLSPEEMRRITLWIDCNSNFYGAYVQPEAQAKGEIVKPLLSLPTGVKFEELVR